jgi:hypothetical protein
MLKTSMGISSCIIGGDLNTHLNYGVKEGGSIIIYPFSEKLSDLISDWDLQDVRPSKGKYTWNNRRSRLFHITTRLDRFLINNNFLLSPLEISSHILPSATSDHKPISLIFNNPRNFGPLPFRFNPLWIDNPITLPLIQHVWSSPFLGSPNFICKSKLKAVKNSLKEWAKSSFIPLHRERLEKEEMLASIQQRLEEEEVTETLLN